MKSALKVALISLISAALLWPDAPPSAPNLISPASLAVYTNTNYVTLTWTSSTDDVMVSNYTLMCTTNGMPYVSNVLPTNTLSTNLYLPAPGYYPVVWSVFARDNSNHTASSGSRTFYMTNLSDVTPPTAAVPLTPTNGTLVTNTFAQFDWQAATDNVAVTKYVVTLLTNGSVWRAISNITGTNISTNVSGAFSNTLMKWTVRAYDAANNSTASATNNFSWIYNLPVDNPPSAPGLAAPANNAWFTNTNGLTFNWTPSTDDIALSNYTLVTRTNGGAWASNAYATNVLSGYLSFTFGSVLNIQWFVLSRDSANHVTASSATNNVTLTNTAADAIPPSAPLLVSPAPAAALSSTNATFLWTAATDNVGVGSYTLTLLTNGGLWQQVSGLGATNKTLAVAAGFSNASLAWFVRAFDAAGNSAVSSSNAFSWSAPAAAPPATNAGRIQLLAPTANASVASNIDRVGFFWAPTTNSSFDRYQLLVYTYTPAYRLLVSNDLASISATADLSAATNGVASNMIRLYWTVNGFDASGRIIGASSAAFTLVPPPQPGRGDIRPLVQDPVGQQIIVSQSNSAAVLEYMAAKSNTVIPPIYNGEEVPLKYKVDARTGAPLTARIIRVYDRRGRLIFEKAAPRGSFASWDKKDRQNRPVPAGMYVLEIVYDDDSSERAMTVVPK
jgi:hypothetical protein